MKHTLILFSGQTDSIQTVTDYVFFNKNTLIDLLYIKNIGFRNCDGIPIDTAMSLANDSDQIINLYVIDGGDIQRKLLKDYAENFSEKTADILDCCILCQFIIQGLYTNVANKLNCNLLQPKKSLFPESIMRIITLPHIKADGNVQKHVHSVYTTKTKIERTKLVKKCQLATFHNYEFDKYFSVKYESWFKNNINFEDYNVDIIKIKLKNV